MKFWQTVQLVVISIVALVGITLLTGEPPKKIQTGVVDIKNMPKIVELIGYKDKEFNTNSIIKKGSIIFVGNSQSIILANTLYKMLQLPIGKFAIVSNISDAPWFMKRWQAYNKESELKGSSNLPWIYDRDGKIRNFLHVPTSDALKYFIYHVDNSGKVKKIYNGKIENFDPEKGLSKDQMEKSLKQAVSIIKNTND